MDVKMNTTNSYENLWVCSAHWCININMKNQPMWQQCKLKLDRRISSQVLRPVFANFCLSVVKRAQLYFGPQN